MPDNRLTLKAATAPVAFDVSAVSADFPLLAREVHGKPLVYLDNAASAQKVQAVLDVMTSSDTQTYANVHRGIHFLSSEATRETARRFVNAARLEEIVFTKGGTEAINLVASSLGAEIEEGDEIIVSDMEHHSNIVPWHFLRERKGTVLKWVPVTGDGCQGLVHETVDVQALDCDFYVATAHKLYGLSGIGFFYGKHEHLETMQPYQGGGERSTR